jgi:hypothetical protein
MIPTNNKIGKSKRGSGSTKQKAKKPKVNINKPGKKRASPKVASTAVRMSECAMKYALAIAEPFNPSAFGACVPDGASELTMKRHSKQVIPLTIGTAGYAYALFMPTVANDAPNVLYTTPTYSGVGGTGTAFSATNTLSSTVTYSCPSTLPFTSTNFSNNSQYNDEANAYGRVVSMGIKCQYTGTTLNEGGLVYVYSDPNHENVSGLSVSSGLLTTMQTIDIEKVSRENVIEFSISAVNAEETPFSIAPNDGAPAGTQAYYPFNSSPNFYTTYNGSSYTSSSVGSITGLGNNTSLIGAPVAMMTIQGTPGNTFLMEIITHAEYIGPAANAGFTPTSSDPIALNKIMNAAQVLPVERTATKSRGWKLFRGILEDVYREAKPMVVPMLVTALKALIV